MMLLVLMFGRGRGIGGIVGLVRFWECWVRVLKLERSSVELGLEGIGLFE